MLGCKIVGTGPFVRGSPVEPMSCKDVGFDRVAISCGNVGDANELEVHPYGVEKLKVAVLITCLDETVG
jgi:hypothetical protein